MANPQDIISVVKELLPRMKDDLRGIRGVKGYCWVRQDFAEAIPAIAQALLIAVESLSAIQARHRLAVESGVPIKDAQVDMCNEANRSLSHIRSLRS